MIVVIMIVVSNIGAIANEILVRGTTKQLLYNFVFINEKFPTYVGVMNTRLQNIKKIPMEIPMSSYF